MLFGEADGGDGNLLLLHGRDGSDGWKSVDHAGLHFFRRVSALRRTLDGRRVSGAPTKLLRAAGPRTTIGVAASHGFLVGS